MTKPSDDHSKVAPAPPNPPVDETMVDLVLIQDGDDGPPSPSPVAPVAAPQSPGKAPPLARRATPAARPNVTSGIANTPGGSIAAAHARLFQELASLTNFKVRKGFVVSLVVVAAIAGGVAVTAYIEDHETAVPSVAELLESAEVQIITDPSLIKGIEYIDARIREKTYPSLTRDSERLASTLISADDRELASARSEESEKLALHKSVVGQHLEHVAEQARLAAEAAQQAKLNKKREELTQKAAERERLPRIAEEEAKRQLTPEQISGALSRERRLTGGMTAVTGAEDRASVEAQGKALATQLKAWKASVNEK